MNNTRRHNENFLKILTSNIVIRAIILLIGAYGAGVGTYKAVLEMASLDVVAEDSYVKVKDISKEYITKENCAKELNKWPEYTKRIADLEKKQEPLWKTIQAKLKELKPIKISAQRLKEYCEACKATYRGGSSYGCQDECTSAGKALGEMEILEKEIKLIQDAYNALEERIKNLELKL